MDSIALQLAVKYATKSGKLTLAQKIIDELIEHNKEQEQKQIKEKVKENTMFSSDSSSFTSKTSSTTTISSVFEPLKQTRSKVETTNVPFSNPFRKKKIENSSNESSTNDEFSKWKPSINKSRLSSSNKTTVQVEF